jgi:hypothetical protein
VLPVRYELHLCVPYGSQQTAAVSINNINWGGGGGLALQIEGGSNETVKYGLSSAGLGPQSDCYGKAQNQSYE